MKFGITHGAWSAAVRVTASFLCAAGFVAAPTAHAQNATNGKALYTAVLVPGQLSCGAGTCHGPSPTLNQNKIKNGATAAKISSGISGVSEMRFLAGVLTTAQLNDLAAYIVNPSAAVTTPTATLYVTALNYGSVTVGVTSPEKVVTLSNTGGAPLQLSAVTMGSGDFAISGGTCTATTTLAVATTCTVNVTFAPTAAGARSATLSIAHNASGGTSSVALSGTGVASTSATTATMVEYFHAGLDYYFITSRATEIALLDSVAAWARTGKSFNVYTTAQAGTAGLVRYYYDQIALANSRGSHFYTAVQAEKDLLASLNPTNAATPRLPLSEGVDSYLFAPVVAGVGGSCAAGQTPVYRIFRGQTRFPDNPNHRYTTDTAIYNSFVALGWDGEGVKLCAPQ